MRSVSSPIIALPRSGFSLTQKQILILSLAFATAVKLYLALFTVGSFDLLVFRGHLSNISNLGVDVYRTEGPYFQPFNHPPPFLHFIRFIGWLSRVGVSFESWFGFWLRLSAILADLGSFFVVYKLMRKWSFRKLLVFALCPTAVLISGFHGQTDPIMVFFLLLAIYLAEKQSHWAGVAFALSICVKVVPLIFLPAFFLYLSWRKRFEFFGLAALVLLLCSLPYILQDPIGIGRAVLGYSSIYGRWGWTMIAAIVLPDPPQFAISHGDIHYGVLGPHAVVAQVLKGLTIALAIVVPLWLKRERLFAQCAVIMACVLFFAPGFGLQYLSWLIPFALAFEFRFILVYYATTTVFLLTAYICYAMRVCPDPMYLSLMSLATWLSIAMLLARRPTESVPLKHLPA
jgi:hypothetical protein